ncbi:MAG TPA: hemolysin family protein [Candidatus Limiplasma sp.]|nr:hemolysin family protein [Candidatus Limiplasma sp.]HRX08385.1 hemolysin family protein [Candidatus Limiplasma sp.]
MDDPIGSQLLLQFVLILINAFFAATEIAVISINENKVRKQAEEGDKKAAMMLRLAESPSDFLSTIQVAITLGGFLASAFAASNFAGRITRALISGGFTLLSEQVISTVSMIVVTIILSYFTLVLGELAPKRIAMQNPEKVARLSSRVIIVVQVIFKPIVWLLSVSTNGILRLLRINPNADKSTVTEEEIRLMVDIGGERGTIQEDEREMIENIFEFNNITAEYVMVHRMDVVAIHVEDSFEEIIQTIRESGLSRFPVYDEDIDDITGILNTRDFLMNALDEQQKSLRELLRPAYLVPETVPADVLFRDMQKQKVHMAIVVDEYGGMSGIVTMEDLIEEIVGNIYDEFDPAEEIEVVKVGDNLWRCDGSVELETLADALEIELPLDEEYDTLGGMVFSCFNTIPEDGSTPEVDIYGLHIKVEEIIDHRLEKALVSIIPPAPAEDDKEKDKDREKDKN